MAEALSTVFNFPSNQGAATIIPNAGPGFLDIVTRSAMTQQALKAKKAKASSDGFKDVKLKESWRVFSPAVEDEYSSLLNRTSKSLASGTFSRADLSADVARVNRLADASMQLREEVERIDADYTKNKYVNEGSASEEMKNRLIGSGTVADLEKASLGTVEKDFYLSEMGGSKHLNENEVMNDLLKNSLNGWLETKVQEGGKWAGVGRGLLEKVGTENEVKMKSFMREDKNGNIKIMDPDLLREAGISNLISSNPYSDRLARDKAMDIAAARGDTEYSEADYDAAVYSMLKGREAGESKRREITQTGRTAVDFGASAANFIGKFMAGKLESMEQGDLVDEVGLVGPTRPDDPPLVLKRDDIFLGRTNAGRLLVRLLRERTES